MTHPAERAQIAIEPGWNQMIHAAAGVLTVLTAAARCTVPVGRAVWIPAGIPVEIDNARPVRVRIVYLQRNPAGVAEPFPADRPTVVSLSPFARELLAHVVRQAPLKPGDPLHSALVTVLVDQLRSAPVESLELPLPTGELGRLLVVLAFRSPGTPAATLARDMSVAVRTLERHVWRDTGLTLGLWLRRARILTSLETLTNTGSVTRAAAACGYATPSAYIVAFSRELGTTPARFGLRPGPAPTSP
ncbi:helix-turn-helix domain-containing protein [Gordonia polyisoprenivorans]|uniref:helix-turn-helix domain-containing protein n=1 Tax=Gordonia polyisoprenivorans TaxID=84595 RepID=UPI000B99E366|nr:helix-turn-helix transcriptional regulator [Gordonia polyisoprenivorans]OZC34199.1 AraC family transcriptional regulator [Gordonia polyisoprenivorans]